MFRQKKEDKQKIIRNLNRSKSTVKIKLKSKREVVGKILSFFTTALVIKNKNKNQEIIAMTDIVGVEDA
tara:strand:- start:2145 stop:2351 length:207 start_codon:yes stop_codon:yes gene_type:complete